MGVLDRAKQASGVTDGEDDQLPFVCLACESPFEVQHHSCPVCGSFDLRSAKWVQD